MTPRLAEDANGAIITAPSRARRQRRALARSGDAAPASNAAGPTQRQRGKAVEGRLLDSADASDLLATALRRPVDDVGNDNAEEGQQHHSSHRDDTDGGLSEPGLPVR
ncbi:MAG: hypothetical protein M3Z29_06850 [Pseudomonadota bacterium]|nr:hypothetical protein [Pseudomonadota bacterium]